MALSPEARHRAAGLLDDMTRKKSPRMKVLREVEKLDHLLFADRSWSCNFRSLQLGLFTLVFCAVITLTYSPAIYRERKTQGAYRLVDMRWIWDHRSRLSKPPYVAEKEIQWDGMARTVSKINSGGVKLRVGLLNFNSTEVAQWQQTFPMSYPSVVHLDPADSNVTWGRLYPEWIDEEEAFVTPFCPSLPEPYIPVHALFHLVAVKLPCRMSESWSRDVARLHLQLTAAKVAIGSAKGGADVYVMLVTECLPLPNLFSCKHLVERDGDAWLYKPGVRYLKERIRVPVGSCELSVPLKAKARLYSVASRREAYATVLHSADAYVCGAIAAAQSIRQSGSTRDLIILVDEMISPEHRSGLQAAGWKVRTIQRIRNPRAVRDSYNEWNYSKFRLWQLTDYDKIIFIDADLVVLRNIDFLFAMPEVSATGNNGTLFNSGVMVIEPCNCTFHLLLEHIHDIHSYNGGDQGYLNEVFTWWHRVPRRMNFLKHVWAGDEARDRAAKARLLAAEPPVMYVVHYLGIKPWLCFRDYDCNWNVPWLQHFASDEAHARWWAVHDSMQETLQRFCLLPTRQKAALEYDRRQAQKANASDMHWKREVRDPRRGICADNVNYCDWESMLQNWGS